MSVVEAKHRVLNTVLAGGFANGQITDGKKFKIFVEFAQIRETHTTKAGHVSQYELWCGQAPNTVESLITAMQEDVINPSSISTDDPAAAQMVEDQCRSRVIY